MVKIGMILLMKNCFSVIVKKKKLNKLVKKDQCVFGCCIFEKKKREIEREGIYIYINSVTRRIFGSD